jgi:hypothetical protein
MTDPKRLMESGTEIERTLLAYGGAERPAASARQSTLASLGATSVAASAASSSAGGLSAGHVATKALVLAIKWGGGAVLAGALVGGALHAGSLSIGGPASEKAGGRQLMKSVAAVKPTDRRPAGPAPTEEVITTPADPNPAPAPGELEGGREAFPSSVPGRGRPSREPRDTQRRNADTTHPGSTRVTDPAPDSALETVPIETAASELSAEVTMLEQARNALTSGDPVGALRALDEHAARFARPELAQEAQVLMVEALVNAGRTREALDLAQTLREAHPRTPYAKRIDTLFRHLRNEPNP